MSEKSYQSAFLPHIWRKLSFEQRLQALQDLENDHAAKAGRQAFTVKAAAMKYIGSCGEAVFKHKTILINQSHIQSDKLYLVAMATTLHEGRHAYQRAVVEDQVPHKNREQVRLWRINTQVYIPMADGTEILYRFQPLERDAEAYARFEMNELIFSLEHQHGPVEDFRLYIGAVEKELQDITDAAVDAFGRDFEKQIDASLQRSYEKDQAAGRQTDDPTQYKSRRINHHDSIFKIVVELPDGRRFDQAVEIEQGLDAKERFEKLEQAAKDFRLRTVIRAHVPSDQVKHVVTNVSKATPDQILAFEQEKAKVQEQGRGHGF